MRAMAAAQEPSTSVDIRQVTAAGDIVELTHAPLDCMAITNAVRDAGAGAIATFIGTTRNSFEGGLLWVTPAASSGGQTRVVPLSPAGKVVTRLTYEAYSKLCIRTFAAITRRARDLASTENAHAPEVVPASPPSASSSSAAPTPTLAPGSSLKHIALHHRLGTVPVGQASIVIAVSSPHRRAAFAACEWILEEVKREAQVWKREWYADAEEQGDEAGSAWKANAPPA